MCDRKLKLPLRLQVQNFVDLYQEYEEITELLPYENSVTIIGAPNPAEQRNHIARLLRLTLIRKFIFQASDVCNMVRILDEIIEFTEGVEPEVCESARLGKSELLRRIESSPVKIRHPGGLDKLAHSTVRDVLYGSLLHGDTDKRDRVDSLSIEAEIMLATWLPDIEDILRIAKNEFICWLEQGKFPN